MSKEQKELEKAVDSLWLKNIIDVVECCRIKGNIKRHFARKKQYLN